MKNLKYFLLLTIVLWLIGFWYMFSGSRSNESVQQHESDKAGGKRHRSKHDLEEDSSNNMLAVIKRLEKELAVLETKYQQNEQIIQDLRVQAKRASRIKDSAETNVGAKNIAKSM